MVIKIKTFMVSVNCSCGLVISLCRTYWCDICQELKCRNCCEPEIACYFCPNCLFEVPSSTVKSEKGVCTRSCFQCPLCYSSTILVENDETSNESNNTSNQSNNTSNQSNNNHQSQPKLCSSKYTLNCPNCNWKTDPLVVIISEPTGIYRQISCGKSDTKMESFKRLWDETAAGFNNMKMDDDSKGSDYNESPISQPNMHESQGANLLTLEQRLHQRDLCDSFSLKFPAKTRLSTKLGFRCRTCDHALIKPEPKAQSTKFKIKKMAIDFIPNILVSYEDEVMIVLKVINPRSESVSLSFPSLDLKFDLKGRQELQDIDSELISNSATCVLKSIPPPSLDKCTILVDCLNVVGFSVPKIKLSNRSLTCNIGSLRINYELANKSC